MPTTDNRPLKVFLCHASQDKPAVREIYSALKLESWIDPWLDKAKILPGQDWRTVIERAVEESDVVIVCLSTQSVSKEGFVQREIKYAYDIALEKPQETIFLIPLRLDQSVVPRGLRTFQWVDYFGVEKMEAYSNLLDALNLRHEQKLRLEREERTRQEKEEQLHDAAEETPINKVDSEAGKLRREDIVQIAQLNNDNGNEEEVKLRSLERQAIHYEVIGDFWNARKIWYEIRRIDPLFPRVDIKIRELETALKVTYLRIGGTIGIIFILFWIGSWAIPQIFSPAPTSETSVTPLLTNPIALSSIPIPFTKTTAPTAILTPALLTPEITSAPVVFADPHPDSSDFIDAFGVPMRLVPEGEFAMGSDNGESDEKPVHTIYLDAYYIDKYEVTNAHYKACVDSRACQPPQNPSSLTLYDFYGNSKFGNYPVMFMSWDMAKTYCEWRGAQLPTEAQWEKAARGRDGRTYPWGGEIDQTFANYDRSESGPAAVGSYEMGKSPYGVYDMAGNVWEWVEDWYSKTFYANSPASNPSGPGSGQSRVLRGGTWYYGPERVRAFSRDFYNPDEILDSFGFRCAKDANP